MLATVWADIGIVCWQLVTVYERSMEAGAHGEVDEFVAKYQEAIQLQRNEQASFSASQRPLPITQ